MRGHEIVVKSVVIAVCLILFIIIASVSLAQSGPQTTSPEEPTIQVAPVRVDDMVLFHVRGIKAFPAGDRAEVIEERIKKIAADPAVKIDSITSVESKMSTDLVADGRPIMSIFDVDASLEGVPRQILAKAYITKLRESIEKYRKDRITESLIKNALFALLATVIFIVSLKLLLWLLRKLNAVIESRYKAKVHALHIQSLEFIHAERIWEALTGAVKVIRLVLILMLLYFYLNVVLSLFPWTRLLAANLLDYALVPLRTMGKGLVKYIPNLIFIIIFVFLMKYVVKMIRLFFTAIESETIKFAGFDKDWARPTYKAVRLLMIVFAAVIIYPHVPGSDTPAFKGISIFLGLLFSLGSTSAIANMVAGTVLTYTCAFQIGDRVKIGEAQGDVM